MFLGRLATNFGDSKYPRFYYLVAKFLVSDAGVYVPKSQKIFMSHSMGLVTFLIADHILEDFRSRCHRLENIFP